MNIISYILVYMDADHPAVSNGQVDLTQIAVRHGAGEIWTDIIHGVTLAAIQPHP